MILIILMIAWLAVLAALTLRIAIVRRESTGSRTEPMSWERSPRLLDAGRNSLRRALDDAIEVRPVVSSSEPATAEHVRDGAQEDLYVGP